MNFKKVINTYGYPVISKEVSRDVGRVQKNGGINSRTGQLTWSYKSLNGDFHSIADKSRWKFLIDAPFKISNECCDIMKKKPLHRFEKESGLKAIIGTMTSESRQRCEQWLQFGCNSFDAKNPSSKPLSFWTEQDIFAYLKKYNLKYASVYGDIVQNANGQYYSTGYNRTGCVFCAYGCHLEKEPNRFQLLRQTHPKLWDYCMRPLDKGGLNMREVLNYIGVKIE